MLTNTHTLDGSMFSNCLGRSFSQVRVRGGSYHLRCYKMWPPLFAPVYLLSLLDDVIPDWDLREREKEREEGVDDYEANPSKKTRLECCCWTWSSA